MNQKTKIIYGAALFVAIILIAFFAYNALSESYQPDSASAETNEQIAAPDFTVYDSDGNEVRLSDFAGQPVIINFWASWCPPCRSEMPHFNLLYNEEKDNVVFLMIDLTDGQRETQTDGEAYIEDQGYDFEPLFDLDMDAASQYGIQSIPTTIFVDRDGYIKTGYQGALSEETLRQGIELIR